MARMNPAGDPADVIRDGLYVPPADSVATQLVKSLELAPSSAHLILGGIGSGKTSELLRVQKLLNDGLAPLGDRAEYVDVSRIHDLNSPRLAGVLIAIAGLRLADLIDVPGAPLSSETRLAIKVVREFALGHTVWRRSEDSYDDSPHDDPDLVPQAHFIPGVLSRPSMVPEHLAAMGAAVGELRKSAAGIAQNFVFLFDSLDRLPNPNAFRDAVQHDVRVLRAAGVGVAVVGPTRLIGGFDRADIFDKTHFQLSADPEQPDGIDFLRNVLRRRSEPDLLPPDSVDAIARASGGGLRDMIAIAKTSAEEAYAAGSDPIGLADVGRAVDMFGRNLAFGMDSEQAKLLRHLRLGGGFVIRGERELSLLETRRVLLFRGPRWVVHPALTRLLDSMPEPS